MMISGIWRPDPFASLAATGIAFDRATSGGTVTVYNPAVFTITSRGVCWNTTGTPTTADPKTANGSGAGTFTSLLAGLLPNTTYYARAYAVADAMGTAYGNEISFTTNAASKPSVLTADITGISANSALGGGNVTADGGLHVSARGVCWNIAVNPTTAASHTKDGSGRGSFFSSLTGLNPNTTYYVRAYATNKLGTSYGQNKIFSTLMDLPSIAITSPAAGAVVDGVVTITADSSVQAKAIEFHIDGSVLANEVLLAGHSESKDNATKTRFNIDDSEYLFIDHRNQLKKISKSGVIGNVLDTDLDVAELYLNNIGEVFIRLAGGIVLNGNFYEAFKIDTVSQIIRGIQGKDMAEVFPQAEDIAAGDLLGRVRGEWGPSRKIEKVFHVDHEEYVFLEYQKATGNYRLLSTSKNPDSKPKTVAFLRDKPLKVTKNIIYPSFRRPGEMVFDFSRPTVNGEMADGGKVNQAASITYQTTWDTLDYPDGIHKVKALAEDVYGRAFFDEIEVEVRNLKINLNVTRKIDTAMTFEFQLAEIVFGIENPQVLPISTFAIFRSESGGEFVSIKELPHSFLADSRFTYYDTSIKSDKSYTYKIVAYDGNKNILSESEEKTI